MFKKIKRVLLSGEQAERLARHHSAIADDLVKKGRYGDARYHAHLATAILRGHIEPSTKERRQMYLLAQSGANAPFKKGKGKGFDIYSPSKGIKPLEGIVIVEGPDKYPKRFTSMQSAIDYVKVHNFDDFPVRVHKKP